MTLKTKVVGLKENRAVNFIEIKSVSISSALIAISFDRNLEKRIDNFKEQTISTAYNLNQILGIANLLHNTNCTHIILPIEEKRIFEIIKIKRRFYFLEVYTYGI